MLREGSIAGFDDDDDDGAFAANASSGYHAWSVDASGGNSMMPPTGRQLWNTSCGGPGQSAEQFVTAEWTVEAVQNAPLQHLPPQLRLRCQVRFLL